MINKLILLALITVTVYACVPVEPLDDSLDATLLNYLAQNAPNGNYDYYIMPASTDYDKLPNQDPNNEITQAKIDLGKLLFHETGLAQDSKLGACYETYSCSSCHIGTKGFLPGRFQGIADGAEGFGYQGSNRRVVEGYTQYDLDAQGNRPMTVMNVTYMTNTLWSGLFGANDLNVGTKAVWTGSAAVNHTGYYGLEAQNIEGMKIHRLAINDKVLYKFGYDKMFDKAFPEMAKVMRYSPVTASFAISAYLRSILTNRAPFQDYLKGDKKAITESQKKGAIIFFDKAGCASCHNSPSFSAMKFFALGTKDMYEFGGLNTSVDDARTRGRAMFTGSADDMFKFKVPQLYNLKDYVTFFHGSSKNSIREVIDYKLKAKSENALVADKDIAIRPITLTEEEKNQLEDFLTNALYDDNMARYMPTSVLSGYCFPNNDKTSKLDMGCK